MNLPEIDSKTLGKFRADPEPPEMPILCSTVRDGDREIGINLVALSDTPDWHALVGSAEQLFPIVLANIPAWLDSRAEQVLSLHREYYEGEWQEDAHALIGHVSLNNVNFADDGTVELWFEGDMAFHCLDVNINLDPDLKVAEVRFDG